MCQNSFINKYVSKEMQHIFNKTEKFKLWRRLWIILAECERTLGLPISDVQIQELKKYTNDINIDVVNEFELKLGHDVMANIYAFGTQCPIAAGILHLGADNCYITDNANLIIIKNALDIIINKLKYILNCFDRLACKYEAFPCLSFPHYQAVQPNTVGRRFTLWAQDFLEDYLKLTKLSKELKFRGVKGTVSTQTNFLVLFNGDKDKVKQLDRLVTAACGFDSSWSITGQTYPRKQDINIVQSLAQIACSANKFATDFRLLAHDGEFVEPFEDNQGSSSAIPHKQNPIFCDRICCLSRFLVNLTRNTVDTAMAHWLEQSLDDSSNRKLTIQKSFLAVDAILSLVHKILDGVVINEDIVKHNLYKKLPFMFVEPILMLASRVGGDRQKLYNILVKYCIKFKHSSSSTALLDAIKNDPHFKNITSALDEIINNADATLIGMAPNQVSEFFWLNRHLW